MKINENIYSIANIYAHNDKNNRKRYLDDIKREISNQSEGYIIIGGDWNDIQQKEDRKSKTRVKKINTKIKEFKKEINLIDPWKHHNKHK